MTQAQQQIEDFGDEKCARLDMELQADFGLSSCQTYYISRNQWNDIQCIINGEATRTERYLVARLAIAQATAGDEVPSLLRPPLTAQGAEDRKPVDISKIPPSFA